MNIPWIDKYRPKTLNGIVQQTETIKTLKQIAKTGNMPHLLFYGPPGTGKTSAILALAFELFGPNIYRDRVIELNASDERGIGCVRDKIKMIARFGIGREDPDYLSPPFKIIILDEADAMTTEAQSALRKIIEDYSSITRFCIICNYINQIIDPLVSRCSKFRFTQVIGDKMNIRLKKISEHEGVEVSDKQIKKIMKRSNGDMRKSIMMLQNMKYLKGDLDEEMFNILPKYKFDELLCLSNKDGDIMDIYKYTNSIILDGYPAINIIYQIHEYILKNKDISDENKALIFIKICDAEKKLITGANELLQLLDCICYIHNLNNK
jgi:replication factor C subunit 2/4